MAYEVHMIDGQAFVFEGIATPSVLDGALVIDGFDGNPLAIIPLAQIKFTFKTEQPPVILQRLAAKRRLATSAKARSAKPPRS